MRGKAQRRSIAQSRRGMASRGLCPRQGGSHEHRGPQDSATSGQIAFRRVSEPRMQIAGGIGGTLLASGTHQPSR